MEEQPQPEQPDRHAREAEERAARARRHYAMEQEVFLARQERAAARRASERPASEIISDAQRTVRIASAGLGIVAGIMGGGSSRRRRRRY